MSTSTIRDQSTFTLASAVRRLLTSLPLLTAVMLCASAGPAAISIKAELRGGQIFVHTINMDIKKTTPRGVGGSLEADIQLDVHGQNVDGADAIEMQRYDPARGLWAPYSAFGRITMAPLGPSGSVSSCRGYGGCTVVHPGNKYRLVTRKGGSIISRGDRDIEIPMDNAMYYSRRMVASSSTKNPVLIMLLLLIPMAIIASTLSLWWYVGIPSIFSCCHWTSTMGCGRGHRFRPASRTSGGP